MEVVVALVTSFTVWGLNAYVTPMPSLAVCERMVPAIEASLAENADNLTYTVMCVTVAMPEPAPKP
ncbi:MAG: hypothetical protein ACREER_02060 [Alphaproteobacteria bacterium]